ELESWIRKGIPVVTSVAYGILKGTQLADGHLVVVAGFAQNGEVIVNDPGTSEHVRKQFSRENFRKAWAHSHNTVYLIYPVEFPIPESAGHSERKARPDVSQRGAFRNRN